MCDQERLTRPVAVSLPAEIDIPNAEHASDQFRAAFGPGATAVMTEKGLRVFCCTFGSRQLVTAHKRMMNWLKTPNPK